MDTLAHVTIGTIACSRSGLPGGTRGAVNAKGKPVYFWSDWTFWTAAGFALIPDLSSFGAFIIQRIISGNFVPGKPELDTLPEYVFFNYNLTHSLVIAAGVGFLLWFFARPIVIPFISWPLHILCDIPVHSRDYFPTPFLYPLSDYTINGISFGGNPWVIYTYWSIILILFSTVVLMRGGVRLKLNGGLDTESSG